MLTALINGILIGGVYALISLGLTLVFGVMRVVNFAHAAFLMLGMYTAYFAWRYAEIDPSYGSILAFLAVAVLAVPLYYLLLRHAIRAGELNQLLLTAALLIILENAALLVFGPDTHSVQTPYQTAALHFLGSYINVTYLIATVLSLVAFAALYMFLYRTTLGLAIRATAQNPLAATLIGINTHRAYALAFALGTGLTALGGAAILPYTAVYPTVGSVYVLLMFTAVVLGGLGHLAGAILGGLTVGIIQSLSAFYLPIQLQNLILFALFVVALVFRPQGLLGGAK